MQLDLPGSMPIAISAMSHFLPKNVEDGLDLKEDNPDWRIEDIENKTGIKKRFISDKNQDALDLGLLAAENLFKTYNINRSEVTGLILVTQSPRYALPTSACILQHQLGLGKNCMAFDINLGCSGFVYGLSIAGSLIQTNVTKTVLLVCTDTYTKYIESNDRSCRPIFSDGASAALIEASANGMVGPFEFGTDGSGAENLIVRDNKIFMDGSSVFMFTLSEVPKLVRGLIEKASISIDDVKLIVFHQASKLVIDSIGRGLRLPEAKIFRNYESLGNTVSASIPIALEQAALSGRIQKDDLVMLVGFGVGYSWGACLLKWGGPVNHE